MNTRHFPNRAVGVATLIVMLSIGAFAQAAAATQIGGSGPTGYVSDSTVTCTYNPNWNQLNVKVPPPSIYAPNRYAGSGNDWAATRYAVLLVDQYRQPTRSSQWSSWAVAYDNRAAYIGGPISFTSIPDHSRVLYWVQWVGPDGTFSQATYLANRYQLLVGGASTAGQDSCAKVKVG